jgi:hypothetical protein
MILIFLDVIEIRIASKTVMKTAVLDAVSKAKQVLIYEKTIQNGKVNQFKKIVL